jgi:4-hydroxythreonine-4-phosphate dehydrogenase
MATPNPIALTMGEPAGIGGELTLKVWLDRQRLGLPVFFAIDDPDYLSALARRLGWDVPVTEIETPESTAAAFDRALPVLANPLVVPTIPGQPDPANGEAVLSSIRQAATLTETGEASAVVTNPVHKQTLYKAGFAHPGHTEFLAELAGVARSVMMLLCPALRVVPVTGHVPLSEAIERLTTDEIVDVGRITAAALETDFGIDRPRLAIAALNPHAGEYGALGREENEIIVPAVERLKSMGIAITGPAPADTLFHEDARGAYDAALCMYHDQALIPLKTVDFWGGVNVTLGLPIVRTSPDHGTALDIAGQGSANPASLAAAIETAAEIVACRARTGHGQRQVRA